MNNNPNKLADTLEQASQDPRIVRSRAAVQQSVLTLLMSGRDFGSLSVSEVALSAGVTRKTFYSRFGSLEQVVDELVLDELCSISDQIDDAMLKFPLKDSSLAMLVFEAYQRRQDVLGPLVRHCPAGVFMKPASRVFESLLKRATRINAFKPMPQVEQEYLVAMVGSMTHALLTVWLERGFTDPPEQLAELVYRLFGTGLENVMNAAGEASETGA